MIVAIVMGRVGDCTSDEMRRLVEEARSTTVESVWVLIDDQARIMAVPKLHGERCTRVIPAAEEHEPDDVALGKALTFIASSGRRPTGLAIYQACRYPTTQPANDNGGSDDA